MSVNRIPTVLQDKYFDLVRERDAAAQRIEAIEKELASLEYAMLVLDPEWQPPVRIPKKQRASRLAPGVVSRDCLHLLKVRGAMWTPELTKLVAERNRVVFASSRDELNFASAVAMALRRYEKQGFLKTVDRHPKTGALRWELVDGAPSRRGPSPTTHAWAQALSAEQFSVEAASRLIVESGQRDVE